MSGSVTTRTKNSKHAAGLLLVILLGVVMGYVFGGPSNDGDKTVIVHESPEIAEHDAVRKFARTVSKFESFETPEAVPDQAAIYNKHGDPVSISSYQGKLLVLNFWATWCAPCVKELPSLAKLAEKRPDIAVIAVSEDFQKTAGELRDFLDDHKAERLDVFYDQGIELQKIFPARGIPTTYIISSKGQILYKMEGDTDWSSDSTLTFLDFAASK